MQSLDAFEVQSPKISEQIPNASICNREQNGVITLAFVQQLKGWRMASVRHALLANLRQFKDIRI